MKKLAVAVTLILVIAAIGLILRESSSYKLRRPFFAESATSRLGEELSRVGMVTSSPPILIGETITASISGVTVLFSGKKDVFTQVRALQLVLPGIKMVDKIPKEVDLRFNNVVVRY